SPGPAPSPEGSRASSSEGPNALPERRIAPPGAAAGVEHLGSRAASRRLERTGWITQAGGFDCPRNRYREQRDSDAAGAWLDPSEKQASRSLQTLVTWLPMHLDSQLRQDAGLGLATPCRARDVCGSLFDHLPAEQAGALGQAAQLIVDAMVPRRGPGFPGR